MNRVSVSAAIKQFIVEDLLNGDGDEIDYNTPLLEWGILDSLKVLSLLFFSEEELGVDIDATSLTPVNLATIDAFASLVVQSKQP